MSAPAHSALGRGMDEEDVRVRARGGSPRRTRTRPAHEDARDALVVAVDRGRYTCVLDADVANPPVTAIRGADARRAPVVVGERVALVGDLSGDSDALARIVAVRERRTVLRRSPDDTDPVERPVVANADQLVCVVALADPPPRTGLIDRVLVAALDGGLQPVLCLTKLDRLDSGTDDPGGTLRATYAPIGVPVLPAGRDAPIDPLFALLEGKTSVFFGHSGVGKSTLINRVVPGAARATGGVNEVTGRGRHTSSSVVMLALPGEIAPHGWGIGGWVIDTPGVRSFGLGHVSAARVLRAFPDLSEHAEHCPPDCLHASDSPGCALDDAVNTGGADPERLASLRRLLAATAPEGRT